MGVVGGMTTLPWMVSTWVTVPGAGMPCLARTAMAAVQFIKCLLLAGIQAGVERPGGLLTLFDLGSAFLAQFLRQIQTFRGGQLEEVRALGTGLVSAMLRLDGLHILVQCRLLAGLNLQKRFQAFCACGLQLGKVHGLVGTVTLVASGMVLLRLGRCGRGSVSLGVYAESQTAQQGGSSNGSGQGALEAFHHRFLSGGGQRDRMHFRVHGCQFAGSL